MGLLEPNADYNSMMYSPLQDVLYTWDIFSNGLTFYPGDALNITFENGTNEINDWWLATYTVSDFTGPLNTGGDYYNFFVLGLEPASYDDVSLPAVFNFSATSNNINTIETENLTNWYNSTGGAYPVDPILAQSDLKLGVAGGILTSYFINANQTAILSIPSFDQVGFDIHTFGEKVSSFIDVSRGASQVIIDLQSNTGGAIFLAFVTFRRFFPSIDPFAGSRRRSGDLANVLGTTFTEYWTALAEEDDNKTLHEASEWVVTDRLNAATGANFSSWAEYFGPRRQNDDVFSLVVRFQSYCALPAFLSRPWDFTDGFRNHSGTI